MSFWPLIQFQRLHFIVHYVLHVLAPSVTCSLFTFVVAMWGFSRSVAQTVWWIANNTIMRRKAFCKWFNSYDNAGISLNKRTQIVVLAVLCTSVILSKTDANVLLKLVLLSRQYNQPNVLTISSCGYIETFKWTESQTIAETCSIIDVARNARRNFDTPKDAVVNIFFGWIFLFCFFFRLILFVNSNVLIVHGMSRKMCVRQWWTPKRRMLSVGKMTFHVASAIANKWWNL